MEKAYPGGHGWHLCTSTVPGALGWSSVELAYGTGLEPAGQAAPGRALGPRNGHVWQALKSQVDAQIMRWEPVGA